MKKLILFLCLCICLYANNSTLEMLIVMFRHGGRAPLNSMYDSTWGDMYGQLTSVGMRMEYMLGASILQDYSDFLVPYKPEEVYVRSTDVDRTINSANSVMYGIYGQYGQATTSIDRSILTLTYPAYKFSDALIKLVETDTGDYALPNGYQPIPVHVVEPSVDTLLLSPSAACPAATLHPSDPTLLDEFWKLYQPIVEEINERIEGTSFPKVTSPGELYMLADAILCDYYAGRPQALKYTPEDPNWLNITFSYGYVSHTSAYSNQQYVQMYSVPVFNQLLSYLQASKEGSSQLKSLFLSAHDGTLSLILAALNLTTPECLWNNFIEEGIMDDPACHYPRFTSNIKIELWKNDDASYYVQIYYDDVLLVLPGCPNVQCPYDVFESVLSDALNGYTMEDYNNFCAIKSAESWVQ